MDAVTLAAAVASAFKKSLQSFRPAPASKLLGFNAALANRTAAACDVLVIGDSIGEGVGVNTGNLTNRWASQLIASLRGIYPVANVAGGFGYQAAWNSAGVNPPTETGTVTHATNGLGHRSSILGAGAAITFTSVLPGTSFQLRMKRSTTDAVTVAVDGGTATTITAGPSGEFTYTSAALARQVHSVVVTQTAGTPEIEGLFWMDGDEAAGIRLWDCSKAGAKAGDWTTASGGSQAWLTAATGFTPSLVVLALGTNDATTVSAATFKTNVANLVTAVRGQWANVPILLVGSYQPPSRQAGLIDAWANYGSALRALAAADPAIAYLDLMNAIGSIAVDTYGLLNDTTHPNTKGHQLYAQTVLDFIRPGLRDSDAVRSTAVAVDGIWLDTPSGTTPAVPTARGAQLYSDSTNGAILGRIPVAGDICNTMGRTVAITSSQNPWRLAWRYGRVTTGTSAITLTLPPAGNAGQEYIFKKVDAGTGTVIVAGATPTGNQQTVEGANTKTLSGQWSWIAVRSTGIGNAAGVGWEIVGQGGTVS